jgi:hypothetical protein
VRSTPWVDITERSEKDRSATALGVAAAATIRPSKWVRPKTSGRSTLSRPNIARPYIADASIRRSMMKLSKTRSIVDTTAQTSSTGAIHQLNDDKDQVALDA